MTRSITGRGAWNAANARQANKPFDDLFAKPIPGSTKVLYCTDCKTYTNHCQLPSGEWQCWCARVIPIETDLGTRAIISGGEVFEIREGVSSQQWFENIKPICLCEHADR